MAEVSKELALKLGPSVEHHPMFPKRINMQLVKVLDRNNIQIEIWERGAGYTLASGSSSCAAAGAAFRLEKVDRNINVHMAGGVIQINIHEDGHVRMTGPVAGIAQSMFKDDFRQQVKLQKGLDK
jgi:diaminopimelate epimerase